MVRGATEAKYMELKAYAKNALGWHNFCQGLVYWFCPPSFNSCFNASIKVGQAMKSVMLQSVGMIYIVGPRRLQNELIASCLERETGAKCTFGQDLCHVRFPDDVKRDGQRNLVKVQNGRATVDSQTHGPSSPAGTRISPEGAPSCRIPS